MKTLKFYRGLAILGMAVMVMGCGKPPGATRYQELLAAAVLAAVDECAVAPQSCTILLSSDAGRDEVLTRQLILGLRQRFSVEPEIQRLPVDPMKAQTGEMERDSALGSLLAGKASGTLVLSPGWVPGLAGFRPRGDGPFVIAFCPDPSTSTQLLERHTLGASITPKQRKPGENPPGAVWERLYQISRRDTT